MTTLYEGASHCRNSSLNRSSGPRIRMVRLKVMSILRSNPHHDSRGQQIQSYFLYAKQHGRPRQWAQPSTTPSPSLAVGGFTVTHPFHPLYNQRFEILNYQHNWGEYRVTFYQTPEHVRTLPAAWTSIVPPDPSQCDACSRSSSLSCG